MARRISVAITGYRGAYAAIWGIPESDVTNAIQNLTNTCYHVRIVKLYPSFVTLKSTVVTYIYHLLYNIQ